MIKPLTLDEFRQLKPQLDLLLSLDDEALANSTVDVAALLAGTARLFATIEALYEEIDDIKHQHKLDLMGEDL